MSYLKNITAFSCLLYWKSEMRLMMEGFYEARFTSIYRRKTCENNLSFSIIRSEKILGEELPGAVTKIKFFQV